jgi:hypothetical protein
MRSTPAILLPATCSWKWLREQRVARAWRPCASSRTISLDACPMSLCRWGGARAITPHFLHSLGLSFAPLLALLHAPSTPAMDGRGELAAMPSSLFCTSSALASCALVFLTPHRSSRALFWHRSRSLLLVGGAVDTATAGPCGRSTIGRATPFYGCARGPWCSLAPQLSTTSPPSAGTASSGDLSAQNHVKDLAGEFD